MSNLVNFECPRCGAPLRAMEGQISLKCDYCGGIVVVPPELRPAPPPPPQPQVISVVVNAPDYGERAPTWTPQQVAQPYVPARRRGGCAPTLVMLLVVGLIGAGIYMFISARSPYFFDNLMAGGYARIDQTFTAPLGDSGLFKSPVDITIDNKNNIYVLDDVQQVVARFSQDGTYANNWHIDNKNKTLTGFAADNGGDVFVTINGKMNKYEVSTGNLLTTSGISDFFGVGYLARLPDGSFITYANGTADFLVHLDASGKVLNRVTSPISEVTSDPPPAPWQVRVAAGKDGSVYLLSTSPNAEGVYVFGPDLSYKLHFGTVGEEQGQLDSPSAIAVDSKGRIYVSDWKGIQVFDARGGYIGIIRLPFRALADGLAFNSRDELFYVTRIQAKVYKFVLNEP